MYVFAVVDLSEQLAPLIESLFSDADRCKAADNVWFVRSSRLTSSEVVADLGIKISDRQGIVIKAEHYDGVASRDIVQKLSAWERG